MRPSDRCENPVLDDTAGRLSSLSIIIDDFDSTKPSNNKEQKMMSQDVSSSGPHPPSSKIYTRQPSDASIKKILEEAEQRRNDFWKLIDEHHEVVENIKRIERLEHNIIKVQPPIST